jgi:hypothetical protein
MNIEARSAFFSIGMLLYFFRAGAGHSGWQVPTVPPPTPKQQPHGRLQMSPLVHVFPHATIACVPVRNWRTESALAESTARNIEAIRTFFTIGILLYGYLLFRAGAGPSGWQIPVVRPLNRP